MRQISHTPGFDPPTVQPVGSHYTDWAIPAPLSSYKVNYPITCLNRHLRLQEVQPPRIYRETANEGGKTVSSTHRRLLLLISVKHWTPQGHSAVCRIKSMKNSSDTIANRTRDLPACCVVPQATAPPHEIGRHTHTHTHTHTHNDHLQRLSDITTLHALQRTSYSFTNSVFKIHSADALSLTQPTDIQKWWRDNKL